MSQDIVEVKCAVLLRRQAFSHQIEDAEAVLVRTKVDQTRLLQHVGVHTGLNIRCILYFNNMCVNYISTVLMLLKKVKIRSVASVQRPVLSHQINWGKIRWAQLHKWSTRRNNINRLLLPPAGASRLCTWSCGEISYWESCMVSMVS